MAIERFSLSLLCPVKSASRRGRSPASNCASSACAIAGNQFPVGHVLPAYRTSSRARRKSGSNSSGGAGGLGLAHRGLGLRARAAQIQQRREHVLVDRRERLGGRRAWLLAGRRPAACRAVPAPCARRSSCRRRECAPASPLRRGGWRGSGRARPARRESSPPAWGRCRSRDQLFEERLLVLREKAVEREHVLAHVGMDAQAHLRARRRAAG